MDLNLKVIGSDIHTSVNDKHDAFGVPIVNCPWLSGDVPRLQSYGIYISQLVRFARCWTSVFVPRFRESVGTLNLIRPSVRPSVCPSVTKTLTLAITFALLQIELWYLACVFLVTRPFRWYHVVTLTVTFDLLQGQICCRAGDHNSLNLLVDFHSKNLQITSKLLTQGYRYHKLRKTFGKFFRSYSELLSKFGDILFQKNCQKESLTRSSTPSTTTLWPSDHREDYTVIPAIFEFSTKATIEK